MLNKLKQTQAQFGGSSDVIDHWLDTRQVLIVGYCQLAALKPTPSKSNLQKLPSPKELQHFCQELVDYISVGHFKVYNLVMEKWQATGFSPTEDMDAIYIMLSKTTDALLNYADRYADVDENDELVDFDDDLSFVGEVMEERFSYEDQLIQLISDSLAMPPGA